VAIIAQLLNPGMQVTDRVLSTVKKILTYQAMVIFVMAFGCALIYGWSEAKSSLLGGGAAWIPNFYLGIRVCKAQGLQAKQVLNAFYSGEAGKLVLTMGFFVIIFQIPDIKILPLLGTYVAALSVFWFALLMR